MSKGLRTSAFIAGGLVIILLVAGLLWRSFTRRALPQTRGTVEVAGLSAPVEIYRDEYGVAHLYADTPHDLFMAQGYVHAQERFWQMEFQRRTGAGRLSEIFGEQTLETDRYLRHLGFPDLVEDAYAGFDEDTKLVLQAYADGVNTYIAEREPAQLGLEFALLNLQGVEWEIEPWTPMDSMLWAQMLVFDQGSVLPAELENLDMLRKVGLDRLSDLEPNYRADRPTIIPSEELGYLADAQTLSATFTEEEIASIMAATENLAATSIPDELATLGFGQNGGSNSWVISGDLTETGMPMLANDPHMGVNMPSLWYEIGLHCNEKSPDCIYDMRGFSLPGIPGFLIGHNDRIAWGLTNAGFDAEDIYVERLNPDNPNQYEVNGEWVDMEIRYEEIIVRGMDVPAVVPVRSTRNGVVVTDSMTSREAGGQFTVDGLELYALSFRWTALEPIRSVQAIMKLNQAQNWDEFREALSYFDAGKQTFIYADVDGNIGIQIPGRVPIRANGDGSLPVPGWNDDYQWTGFIPYDDMPRAFNPEQGYIATANHMPIRPEDYPYLWTASLDRGQRGERLNELIQADEDGISMEDMRRFQRDNYSISAMEIIPYLEDLSFDDPELAAARDLLLTWDGQMHMDSPEAALFNSFWLALLQECFTDEVEMPNGKSESADAVYFLLQNPEAGWWDDRATPDVVETRDDILLRSFALGYERAVEMLGDDTSAWEWGTLHGITFTNATLGESGIGFIEGIFNRGPFPVSGSESVINKTCWNADDLSYETTCMPALRQILDLSDHSNSLMIQGVGQSGHPFHPHYDDFIDPWRTFEYHPSNFLREDVEANSRDLLTLVPAE